MVARLFSLRYNGRVVTSPRRGGTFGTSGMLGSRLNRAVFALLALQQREGAI
jgi:hypothetical protein